LGFGVGVLGSGLGAGVVAVLGLGFGAVVEGFGAGTVVAEGVGAVDVPGPVSGDAEGDWALGAGACSVCAAVLWNDTPPHPLSRSAAASADAARAGWAPRRVRSIVTPLETVEPRPAAKHCQPR
jgi:hypothetical protein